MRFAVLSLLLVVLTALAGCGGAMPAQSSAAGGMPMRRALESRGGDTDHDGIPDKTDLAKEEPATGALAQNAAPASPPPAGQPQPAKPSPVASDAHGTQMLIYTAEENLAVFQVEQSENAVEKIGKDVGGYLSARSDNQIVIRVPRERFQEAVTRIETLGDVIHRNIAVQDVTDEYVDLQARLKNAYNMRDRLTELLKQAPVKEAIDIEKELGQITETIERLEGQLKLLGQKIAYSTITVTFQPVSPSSVTETQLTLPFPWLQELGLSTLMNVHQ
jgi:hypothetical protein